MVALVFNEDSVVRVPQTRKTQRVVRVSQTSGDPLLPLKIVIALCTSSVISLCSIQTVACLFYFFQQIISMEGWCDIMYYIQDSQSFWTWIYFVILIVVSTGWRRVLFHTLLGYVEALIGRAILIKISAIII